MRLCELFFGWHAVAAAEGAFPDVVQDVVIEALIQEVVLRVRWHVAPGHFPKLPRIPDLDMSYPPCYFPEGPFVGSRCRRRMGFSREDHVEVHRMAGQFTAVARARAA
jgi:hypothetical protein